MVRRLSFFENWARRCEDLRSRSRIYDKQRVGDKASDTLMLKGRESFWRSKSLSKQPMVIVKYPGSAKSGDEHNQHDGKD